MYVAWANVPALVVTLMVIISPEEALLGSVSVFVVALPGSTVSELEKESLLELVVPPLVCVI
jgi:hypothetical protein